MTTEILLAILAFGTLGAVVLLAWRSSVRTEERRQQATPKSTIAQDAPNRVPAGERPVDT
jgi:hypothetical protein